VQFSFTFVEEIYHMILIADSGSTKCHWAVCSNEGEIIQIHKTVGFNPKYTSDKNLLDAVEESTLKPIKEKITAIHFYGAFSLSRYKEDMKNPVGGIRHCVEGKGYY